MGKKRGQRSQAALKALDALTKEQAVALLTSALAPEKARSRTILLHSSNHPPATAPVPAFTERNAWKPTRKFR